MANRWNSQNYTLLLFDLVKVEVLPPLTALAYIPWQFPPSPDKVSGLSYIFTAGCMCGSPYIKGNISFVRGENLSLERKKGFFLLMSRHFLGYERKKFTHLVLFWFLSKTVLLHLQQISETRKDSQSCVWNWWGLWERWGKDGGNYTGFFMVTFAVRDFLEKRWGKELFFKMICGQISN